MLNRPTVIMIIMAMMMIVMMMMMLTVISVCSMCLFLFVDVGLNCFKFIAPGLNVSLQFVPPPLVYEDHDDDDYDDEDHDDDDDDCPC